jgi:hypothetical protein
VARVVLDALAEAQLVEHFQVEAGALLDALAFDQLLAWKNSIRSRNSSLMASTARRTVSRGVT